MIKKEPVAVVAGHLCLDIRHPSFEKQQALVGAIQPGLTYDKQTTLKYITNPLSPELFSQVEAFLEEAATTPEGISTGGGVSNTGIPLSFLLPGRVKLMAKVGKDPLSKHILRFLAKFPQTSISLRESGETTSYTIVMNPGRGHSMYAHYPGTNDTFTAADIDFDVVRQARAFEFSYPVLMRQFYESTTALRDLTKEVARHGVKAYVDMHTLEAGKPSGEADWNVILANALPFVHRFCPSLEEALYIYNRDLYHQLKEESRKSGKQLAEVALSHDASIFRKTAEHYLKMGARGVMLKCGPPGMYLRTAENKGLSWDNREIFIPSYQEFPEKRVDTTCAGDNAIAAFMLGELTGGDPRVCCKLAVAAGTLNVEHKGSIGAFHSPADLVRVIRERLPVAFNPGVDFTLSSYTGEHYFRGSYDGKPAAN